MTIPLTFSPWQMDELLQEHPVLKKDRALRMAVCWMLTGRHRYDDRTGDILIPYGLLAFFQDKPKDHAQTGKFLVRLREEVLPELSWRKHWHQESQCRVLTRTGLEDNTWIQTLALERVLARTKRPFTDWHRQEANKEAQQEATRQKWLYPEQQFIADYLHALPLTFFKPEQENLEKAYTLARTLNDRGHALRILHNHITLPKEYYSPSEYGRTPRLFGTNLQFLASSVRHVLYPEQQDLDLVSCQLAILAGISGSTLLQRELKEGRALWPQFLDHLGIPLEQKRVAKPLIKKATYSTVYGMEPRYVERNLHTQLQTEGIPCSVPFLTHPCMQEVVALRDWLKKKAVKEGGMQGAYGWMYYYPGTDLDSFLSCVVQTYELAFIFPVYELACVENSGYTPVLHQHDGVSLLFHPGTQKEQKLTEIQQRVKQKALTYNIYTSIE